MSNPPKQKGDRAELEAARIISDLLGVNVRRKLGAGRTDDTGDLDGLNDWTIEVKNHRRITEAISDGKRDSTREQRNAGTTFGCAFVRHPGGNWSVVMTPEQWATVVREAS